MPNIYWIDLFCGAGGTSTGIHFSGKAKVLACVNHDRNAIKSHEENHPDTIHFIEDIRDKRVIAKIKKIVDEVRKRDPGCIICLWASLECTNHSKAKGGLSRDEDSRSLANYMDLYLDALNPDYFYVENVEEFLDWGPIRVKCKESHKTHSDLFIDKNGKLVMIPVNERKKEYYTPWVEMIKSLGYQYDHRLLNSADFESYQSRKRLFIQFAKHGLPMAWPNPTRQKNTPKAVPGIPFWKPVKEVLDLEDEGLSIFGRKKDLCENTLKRIYAGLVKFVANGEPVFRKQYNGNGTDAELRVKSVNEPCGTILNNGTHAIVSASHFISQRNSGEPGSKVCDINTVSRTITATGGNLTLISTNSFLSNYYSNGGSYTDISGPAPTVTTKDRIAKVDCKFIDQQYGKSKPSSVDHPVGSLTVNPKFSVISAQRWIMNPNFTNTGRSIEEPCNTILASRKHYYLMNPQYNNKGRDIESPCFTLIARMDKMPPYIIGVDKGNPEIIIYDTDSATMKLIKQFMADHGIIDIKMRMLKIPELLQIQGFPIDYKLKGTQTEQKKYIGNAVEVNMARALIDANSKVIQEHFKNRKHKCTRSLSNRSASLIWS